LNSGGISHETVNDIYNDGASSATVTYSDVKGVYPGTGYIDADPMFKDADGPDNMPGTENDNLQLAYNSTCSTSPS